MKSACFAPTLTVTFSGVGSQPREREVACADRLLQRQDAGDGRVLGGDSLVDGLLRGLADEARGLEVRLAHAEGEDVDALGSELGGAGVHRERHARCDRGKAFSEARRHVHYSWFQR